jgi:hypothetical protein
MVIGFRLRRAIIQLVISVVNKTEPEGRARVLALRCQGVLFEGDQLTSLLRSVLRFGEVTGNISESHRSDEPHRALPY